MAKTLLQVQQDVAKYQAELRRMDLLGRATDAEINYTRGRLIAALKQEYALTTNPHQKNIVRANLLMENGRHYTRLKTGIKTNKKNEKHSITKELGLKMKKMASISTDLKYSQTKSDKFANGVKLAGQTVSTAFTLLKYPTTITLKSIGVLSPYIGTIISRMLEVPVVMFSHLINPESPYNGQTIAKMGAGFGKLISQISLGLDNGIKRL